MSAPSGSMRSGHDRQTDRHRTTSFFVTMQVYGSPGVRSVIELYHPLPRAMAGSTFALPPATADTLECGRRPSRRARVVAAGEYDSRGRITSHDVAATRMLWPNEGVIVFRAGLQTRPPEGGIKSLLYVPLLNPPQSMCLSYAAQISPTMFQLRHDVRPVESIPAS